ncbi:MAG: glycosyltransferase family 2 protein, partial [Chloroflexi bacterium]
MDRMTGAPIISVVIPTCNRAELLEATLHSLAEQSIAIDQYEVLVIDDGSVDETPEICRRFHSRLQLRYHRVPKVGISAAKNLGIFASRGAVLLFFDDDDLADCDLLLEHIRAHQRHPEEHVAVLGYTTWAPALPISEVMHYITDVGHIMFGYPALRDGEMLDWTKFWGGRTSCKRAFLTRHGVFNQSLPGAEDDELGFRLARHGLKVLFHRSARSYMNRPFTYDQFCGRCEAIGVCRILFSRIHPEPEIPDHYGR